MDDGGEGIEIASRFWAVISASNIALYYNMWLVYTLLV